MSIERYHLGAPLWGVKAWQGGLFTPRARPGQFLEQYARVFNTVEGNTTFYHPPSATTATRWAESVGDDFRFCPKLGRHITHDGLLDGVEGAVQRFLDGLRPMAHRMGPLFVQLPPRFGPQHLRRLERVLDGLPRGLEVAVEVRHRSFYEGGAAERALEALLGARGHDRIVMDTRPLRSATPPFDDPTQQALERKPDLPVRPIGLCAHPFIRYVAHPDVEANTPWLNQWADVVARWIAEGRDPYFFVHSPGDLEVPELARRFHQMLLARGAPVGPMPDWPGELGQQLAFI